MTRALITGITGQDGSYLAEFLIAKGYQVIGTIQDNPILDNLENIKNQINFATGNLTDQNFILDLLTQFQPDQIYNLAAQSSTVQSWNDSVNTLQLNGIFPVTLFELSHKIVPNARIFQASSAELFGDVQIEPQDEQTPFSPQNPYACAKVLAHQMATIYRKKYSQHISCGILFNHESARRGIDFVTQKVATAAACIKLNTKNIPLNGENEPIINADRKLEIGNLDASRDWGYAPEYVEAMWQMLQHETPDDYVIATGTSHTVKELCQVAFARVGLNWEEHVIVNPKYVRPTELVKRIGNPTKIKQVLGWQANRPFDDWIGEMVDTNLNK